MRAGAIQGLAELAPGQQDLHFQLAGFKVVGASCRALWTASSASARLAAESAARACFREVRARRFNTSTSAALSGKDSYKCQ
jgi:hypothetical protein